MLTFLLNLSELTVLGELRLEGVLMENNKPRKVLLFATMLIIAKAKEDNRLQFKSYIHVSVATVVVGSGDGVGQRFSFLRLHQPLPAVSVVYEK